MSEIIWVLIPLLVSYMHAVTPVSHWQHSGHEAALLRTATADMIIPSDNMVLWRLNEAAVFKHTIYRMTGQ